MIFVVLRAPSAGRGSWSPARHRSRGRPRSRRPRSPRASWAQDREVLVQRRRVAGVVDLGAVRLLRRQASATPARRRRSNRPPTRASGGGPAWSGRTKTRSRDRPRRLVMGLRPPHAARSWPVAGAPESEPSRPRQLTAASARDGPPPYPVAHGPPRLNRQARSSAETLRLFPQPSRPVRSRRRLHPCCALAGKGRRQRRAHRVDPRSRRARVRATRTRRRGVVHIAQRQQPDRRRDLRARSANHPRPRPGSSLP